jgi:hypothetical protein
LLAIPLTFWAAAGLWRRGTGSARCASLALVLLVTCNWGHDFISGVLVFLTLWPVPAPTVEDLFRLCREDDLDYVVLEQEFDGLYSASDGRYFIYDCRHVRALERAHKASPRLDMPPTARAERAH